MTTPTDTVERLYAERNAIKQGAFYLRHVNAMTAEGLHSKSDIAAELAHRDIRIAELETEVRRLREENEGRGQKDLVRDRSVGESDSDCGPRNVPASGDSSTALRAAAPDLSDIHMHTTLLWNWGEERLPCKRCGWPSAEAKP